MNGNKNKRYIAKINTNEKQLVIYFFFFNQNFVIDEISLYHDAKKCQTQC